MQQSDKALRRMAAAEERLARLEGRLAEKDELISEFREAYGRQADTISAMSAVVKELESKIAREVRGIDQVLTGLEGRIAAVEQISAGLESWREVDFRHEVTQILGTQSKPKRGRPKGSKNKPKDIPAVEQEAKVMGEKPPIQQPEGEYS